MEFKKNINKPAGLDVNWIKIGSNDYTRMLYEYGELHVSSSQFESVRDCVRKLWGSVLNWLEAHPEQKEAELSDIVLKTVYKMEKEDKFDVSLSAFTLSLLDGKIGETYHKDAGSFCYEALMAYRAFYIILCNIISIYGIPETERDMPLYPEYDGWVSKSILESDYKEAELINTIFKDELDDITSSAYSKLTVEELKEVSIADEPKYEAFREKVTSCCEVCRSLDDACCAERAIAKAGKN